MIEVGADQLEGARAARDYRWSVGRNNGQGEGGGGNSWLVGGGQWELESVVAGQQQQPCLPCHRAV